MPLERKKIKVLVVEDFEETLGTLTDFIKRTYSPESLGLRSYKHAQALICDQHREFDIVILDLQICEREGDLLADEDYGVLLFEELNPLTPCVVLSGYSKYNKKYRLPNVRYYLEKPYSFEQLQDVIDKAYQKAYKSWRDAQ